MNIIKAMADFASRPAPGLQAGEGRASTVQKREHGDSRSQSRFFYRYCSRKREEVPDT